MDPTIKEFREVLKTIDPAKFPLVLDPPVKARPVDPFFKKHSYEWSYITSEKLGYVRTAGDASSCAASSLASFSHQDRLVFLSRLRELASN